MEEDHELNCLGLGLVVAHSHSHSAFTLKIPISSPMNTKDELECCVLAVSGECVQLSGQFWENGASVIQTKWPSGSRRDKSLSVSCLRGTCPGTKSKSCPKGHRALVHQQVERQHGLY